ncbi:MAG: DUF3108 domain-containing protein [Bacillota bacterium]
MSRRYPNWILVLTAGVLLFLLAGCGKPQQVQLRIPWQPGETSVFQLEQKGEVLGTITLHAGKEDGNWTITSTTEIPSANFTERTSVLADKDTLVPVRTDFERNAPGGTATYVALYKRDRVNIDAQLPEGTQNVYIRLPSPPYYDNEQFTMLLRTMPLKEGWKGTFNVIVTRTAGKTQLTVEAVGKETVRTQAGEFVCWKVDIRGIGQSAWIEVDSPHRLVKYENQGASTVLTLVEYKQGGHV